MKKPWPLYLVALWCLLAMAVVLDGIMELLKQQLADGQNGGSQLKTLRGWVGMLILWHVWRLVQVRTFNRWFSVAFFGVWTLLLTWNCIVLFLQLEHLRGLLSFIIFAVLNVACIGFLTRRSFREFAVQFDVEREKERRSSLAQKTAQRALADELRKPKS
jgi:hypothetical protein